MKSKIKGLEVCALDKYCYITGYEVEVLDDLPKDIQVQLVPTPPSKYLNPVQLELLLRNCNNTKSEEGIAFNHRFIWYEYDKNIYYPNLAIDGVLATRYNIPIKLIDINRVTNEAARESWINYIWQNQQYFYYYFKDTADDPKNLKSYAYEATVEYNALPQYILPTAPTTAEVKTWDDSAYLEQDRMKAEEEEKAEKEKPQIELVPPPFEYDINAPRLVIPRPGELKSVNFPLVKHMLQAVQNSYGVTMDADMVRSFHKDRRNKFDELEALLLNMYKCTEISFNARKYTPKHFAYQLLNYIGEPAKKYVSSNNYISFTKDDILALGKEYSAKPNSTPNKEAILDVLRKNYQAYTLNTELKQINEVFEGLSGLSKRCDYDPKLGNLVFHCTISESETKRFTTKDINVQGKITEIKQMIKAREANRSIVALDIKSQEVAIMVFGVLENKELQRLAITYGDCYRAFADLLNLEYTKELKDIIKVPILSIMNGKSSDTIRREMVDHLDIVEQILHIIYDDPGYRKIYEVASEEAKKQKPVRRGLFGTEVVATKTGAYGDNKGTKLRQSLNGNFQLTAAEIVATCLHAMLYDLITENNKYNLSIDQVTPVVTIYDEVLFDVDNEIKDKAIELIRFYFLPVVQGWGEMNGEFTEGSHYVHK